MYAQPSRVLIVPLWNWNVGTELILNNGPMGSNCTFMELKLAKSKKEVIEITGSNCTFMELKLKTHNIRTISHIVF